MNKLTNSVSENLVLIGALIVSILAISYALVRILAPVGIMILVFIGLFKLVF